MSSVVAGPRSWEPNVHRPLLTGDDPWLRARERRLLNRELYDVVTHQLYTVALQAMSQREGTDPTQLRQALRRTEQAAAAALVDLRLLAATLREDCAETGTDELAGLVHHVAPTDAARRWQHQLSAAGFEVHVDADPRADRLAATAQLTLTRAIGVAGHNIADHAPAGSSCALSLRARAGTVVLRVENQRRCSTSAAYGTTLRALRERVDLVGGVFCAGPSPDEQRWSLEVTVPGEESGTAD